MKKNTLDKTSIVMIVIFAVLVVGSAVGFLLASLGGGKNVQGLGNAVGDVTEVRPTDVKYETYEELGDRFMEICRQGDTEAMYGLYYKDLLSERVAESGASKEEFDAVMKENMEHISYFEEYPYGEGDLIMNSPAGYVNELYYRANDKAFPYSDVNISDCVDLRAYFPNGAYIDFMMANIDGYWYAVV